jgi:hypothetical protein
MPPDVHSHAPASTALDWCVPLRVAGIFVRFYTPRRSVWFFNTLQRNRADFSTSCWLWHRSYQPKRRSPWGGKPQPRALMGCLFAPMSHFARAKGIMRGLSIALGHETCQSLRTFMDHDTRSSVWKTDGFLAVCCRITEASGLEYIFARKCPPPSLPIRPCARWCRSGVPILQQLPEIRHSHSLKAQIRQ